MQRVAFFEGRAGRAACPAAGPAKLQELGIADADVVPEEAGLATWLLPEAAGSYDKLSLAAAVGSTSASYGTTSTCHAPISLPLTISCLFPCACPVCC